MLLTTHCKVSVLSTVFNIKMLKWTLCFHNQQKAQTATTYPVIGLLFTFKFVVIILKQTSVCMLELGQLPPRWGRATGIVGYCYNCNNENRKLLLLWGSPPSWTHLSSTMTSLSFFSAVSRFCVCNKRLSTVTLCCFFCCSMSLSKVCRRSVFLPNLGDQTGFVHTDADSHNQTNAQGWRDSLTYPLIFVSLLHFSPASFVVHSTHREGMWLELSVLHYPLSATNTKMMIPHLKLLQMLP